ncbi:MAG: hypothetical protein WKF83_15190 [Nocardioidaceae bacterium]
MSDDGAVGTARRWSMLAVSTVAQATSAVFMHGPAFLIPVLHDQRGYSLAQAGTIAAASTIGVMTTLILWVPSSTGSVSAGCSRPVWH